MGTSLHSEITCNRLVSHLEAVNDSHPFITTKTGNSIGIVRLQGSMKDFWLLFNVFSRNEVNLHENVIKQKKVKQDCFCTPVYKSMTCKQVDLITFCLVHTFCKMILRPALKWTENNVTSLTSLNILCIFQNACGIRYR